MPAEPQHAGADPRSRGNRLHRLVGLTANRADDAVDGLGSAEIAGEGVVVVDVAASSTARRGQVRRRRAEAGRDRGRAVVRLIAEAAAAAVVRDEVGSVADRGDRTVDRDRSGRIGNSRAARTKSVPIVIAPPVLLRISWLAKAPVAAEITTSATASAIAIRRHEQSRSMAGRARSREPTQRQFEFSGFSPRTR